jgi:exonuclease III
LKILTWNCNLKLREKFHLLSEFESNVILIQECEKLALNHFEGFTYHWIGQNQDKGLGVLTKGQSEFLQDSYRSDFIYFIPVQFKDCFILGAWAFNGRAQKFGVEMSGYFLDALAHYEEQIRSSDKVVIAGDFNNGPQWDTPGHRNNFMDINEALNKLGLFSSYHVSNLEQFGKETLPTYFHQRNLNKPFHIDYIYSNLKPIKTVEVGLFADWSKFSDHVPITAEFEDQFSLETQ